ncbi:MAG: AMP-binding protein, partial [Ktedonobacteraceae bacterium]|nr:AMP-binding protein [Ktedonobacteraceae bacterium]
ELPIDRPRSTARTFRGAIHSLTLPKPLFETLKTPSHREGVTLFMTLLAAFKTLLCRCTGQEDIIVGSPTANRNRAELEDLIGFFINTLVLRTDLSGNPTFRDLLGRVRKATLEAYEYQDLPFEQLVEELHLERDLSRTPLVQAAFSLQSTTTTAVPELGDLTLIPLELDVATTKNDLTLFMSEGPAGLAGAFVYDTDLFDATTITRMAGYFHSLLEAVAADPGQRIWDLSPSPGQLLFPAKPANTQNDKFGDTCNNLSRNQLLIWTGQKLQPDVPLYNMVHTFTISGAVEPSHLQNAFQTLLNSSDTLRTVIEEIDGIPQQRVVATYPYSVECLDFSQAAEPQAVLRAWTTERSQLRFDLAQRLFDTALIKIADQEYLWYLNVHHLITDGWSAGLIYRRVAEFYERSRRGELEEKVELPSYQDYLEYEREYRRSMRFRQVESYWKNKLAEAIEPISFYGKSPIKQTTRVERVSYDLGYERSQRLRALAAEKDIYVTAETSMFNLFAAVLITYLYRVSGNRRLSLGIPFHNRETKAFKETIGLFMEVCPLHLTIEDEDSFLTVIKKVRAETFETLQHRYYFVANPQANKAYDVMLNYHTATYAGFGGAAVKAKWEHTGHENDSLALQVYNGGAGGSIELEFDFHCNMFERGERDQAIGHFLRVMDALLEDRAQRIGGVRLLSGEEERQVLEEYNGTEEEYAEEETIAQLIEEEAEKRPDKTAVVYGGQALSYGEMNRRANQLAHHLQGLGVGPEVRVGLCLRRSL